MSTQDESDQPQRYSPLSSQIFQQSQDSTALQSLKSPTLPHSLELSLSSQSSQSSQSSLGSSCPTDCYPQRVIDMDQFIKISYCWYIYSLWTLFIFNVCFIVIGILIVIMNVAIFGEVVSNTGLFTLGILSVSTLGYLMGIKAYITKFQEDNKLFQACLIALIGILSAVLLYLIIHDMFIKEWSISGGSITGIIVYIIFFTASYSLDNLYKERMKLISECKYEIILNIQ